MIVDELVINLNRNDNDLAYIYVGLERNQTKLQNIISELKEYLNKRDN